MNFLKELSNELGDIASIAEEGISSAQFSGYIDTGCYIFNAVLSGSLYGGLPNNKITAIAGEPATGKSFLALGIAKQFLDRDKKASVVYFDTEAAITKDMLEERDIDTSRVLIVEPDTIQTFRKKCLDVLDLYEKQKEDKRGPLLMVLDSLGMLSTTKEIEDTAEGKETRDMTKAQVIKATFRVLTLRLAKAKVPLIVTNHTYDAQGSYVPTKVMSGGSGLKYSASSIVMLSKSKDREGTDVVGNFIKAKMEKSRLSKENKVATMKLNYKTGLDPYYGLLELGEKYSVFKKVATRYEMPDGSKVFGKAINDNPEKYFTDEVMVKLEVAANKEFTYGTLADDGSGEIPDDSEDSFDEGSVRELS